MKKITVMFFALLVAVSFSACGDSLTSTKAGNPNEVIAIVDGVKEVKNSDIQKNFEKEWKGFLKKYKGGPSYKQSSKAEREGYLTQMRSNLIDYLLNQIKEQYAYEKFFEDKAVDVPQERLDKQLKRIMFYNNVETEDALYRLLKEQYAVEKDDYLRDTKISEKLNLYFLSELQNRNIARPTEKELQDYYNKNQDSFQKQRTVNLHSIVLNYKEAGEINDGSTKVRSEDEAYALSDDIVARLNKGEDFDKLAAKYSDEYSKTEKSLFIPNFSQDYGTFLSSDDNEKIMELAENEVYGPVVTPMSALQIFTVKNVKEARTLAFDDVRDDLEMRFAMQKDDARPVVEEIQMALNVEMVKIDTKQKSSKEHVHDENCEHDFDGVQDVDDDEEVSIPVEPADA